MVGLHHKPVHSKLKLITLVSRVQRVQNTEGIGLTGPENPAQDLKSGA